MTQPPSVAGAGAGRAVPSWLKYAPGLALCAGIAAIALLAGRAVPLVGAPLFAIAIGVVIANTLRDAIHLGTLKTGDISKLALKTGIVILGASLDLRDIFQTGGNSLLFLIVTIGSGIAAAMIFGKVLDIDWRIRCLIGMGTSICGASAIAALAPVLRARAEQIAYAVTVVFFFNMIAVFLFPLLGHLIGLSDNGFGIWTGTAVNDTSAVVAAGFAFSNEAGQVATIVKLTRTTMIIPLVVGFGLALPWLSPEEFGGAARDGEVSLAKRVYDAFPVFILLFLAASLIRTAGLLGEHVADMQILGRLVMVLALAAVGLQGHWRAFVGAGARPLLLGGLTWAVVALTSLAMQVAANQL